MNPDEIKAKAAGKTLQWMGEDQPDQQGPSMHSDLSDWRVKPEPRRMWTTERCGETQCEERAAEWKRKGYTVTEWQEVLR